MAVLHPSWSHKKLVLNFSSYVVYFPIEEKAIQDNQLQNFSNCLLILSHEVVHSKNSQIPKFNYTLNRKEPISMFFLNLLQTVNSHRNLSIFLSTLLPFLYIFISIPAKKKKPKPYQSNVTLRTFPSIAKAPKLTDKNLRTEPNLRAE